MFLKINVNWTENVRKRFEESFFFDILILRIERGRVNESTKSIRAY